MPSAILARLISLALLLLPLGAMGQYTVRGQVVDERGDLPLVGAHVRAEGGDMTSTDAHGHFEIRTRNRRVTLRVTYVGFEDWIRGVDAAATAVEPKVIRMHTKAVELPVAVVRAPAPEVVFESPDLHVDDYLVNSDGLWVLTYDREQLWHNAAEVGHQVLHGAHLHLLDTDLREVLSVPLPTDVRDLHRDYAGRLVVEGVREAWLTERKDETVSLGRMDLGTLHDAVLPWTDSIAGQLLGNNLDPTFPAFDHFVRDMRTKKDFIFCTVVDEFTMELFRSQYKYMQNSDKVIAMDLALDTGVDAEIIAGYMTGFPSNLYFHVPYAPLFVVNDTVCIFDHYKERIRRFDHYLLAVDEVPIVYQRDPHWDGAVVCDREKDAVYALFARGPLTWLQRIDPSTGRMKEVTKLTHPYPSDVQVSGGYVYYVYRPYGSLQKKTLYREELR